MAKYNIMILERINKDSLIVEANRLNKKQPPTGSSGEHGGGELKPHRKSLDERIVEAIGKALVPVVDRLDRIEQRLDKHDERFDKIEKHLDGIDKRVSTLESSK